MPIPEPSLNEASRLVAAVLIVPVGCAPEMTGEVASTVIYQVGRRS